MSIAEAAFPVPQEAPRRQPVPHPPEPKQGRAAALIEIPIDKGIPMPAARQRGGTAPKKWRYPWLRMAKGDSFEYPDFGSLIRTQRKAWGSISAWHTTHDGPTRFMMRTVYDEKKRTDVVRIWRVR